MGCVGCGARSFRTLSRLQKKMMIAAAIGMETRNSGGRFISTVP
jgi:hypothetical protein